MLKKICLIIPLILALSLITPSYLFAAYEIESYTFDIGGGESTAPLYKNHASVGQGVIGKSTSLSDVCYAGFIAQLIDEFITSTINFLNEYPTSFNWQDTHNLTCKITAQITGGNQISKVEYRISNSGYEEGNFDTSWKESVFESTPSVKTYIYLVQRPTKADSTTFSEGENNYIQWRCATTSSLIAYSTKYRIRLDVNVPPTKPHGLAPINMSEINLDATLSWEPSQDSDIHFNKITYAIEIDLNENFSLPFRINNLSSPQFPLSNLASFMEENKVYYWRVKANDNHSDSSGHTPASRFFFNSKNLSPELEIIQPDDGEYASSRPLIEAQASDESSGIDPDSIKITILDNNGEELAEITSQEKDDIFTPETGRIYYVYKNVRLKPGQKYTATVSVKDMAGNETSKSTTFAVRFGAIADIISYPSPFDPKKEPITFRYVLLNDSEVTINIYDMSGRLVKTVIDDEERSSGEHTEDTWEGVNYSGEDLANGIYLCEVAVKDSNGEHRTYQPIAIFGK